MGGVTVIRVDTFNRLREREELCVLSEANPETAFEHVASHIPVMVSSWNGGMERRVTLFEVLKYPTAFSVSTMRGIEDTRVEPSFEDGKWVIREATWPA